MTGFNVAGGRALVNDPFCRVCVDPSTALAVQVVAESSHLIGPARPVIRRLFITALSPPGLTYRS
jgi:hypothetical protein